jgi:pyrimidine operon attenuation protein / uracil phosphoribosyltransferase
VFLYLLQVLCQIKKIAEFCVNALLYAAKSMVTVLQREILDKNSLNITLDRLCQQLIENHRHFDNSVILGLQPRGIFPAQRLHQKLEALLERKILLGNLDATFFRDDFRRPGKPLQANATQVPFLIEDKNVILIDDVLFTGRTVRAALDAMTAFGRPRKVELLVLIDRRYSRELPIEADYVGKQVDSILSQHVQAQWEEQGFAEDTVWLMNTV